MNENPIPCCRTQSLKEYLFCPALIPRTAHPEFFFLLSLVQYIIPVESGQAVPEGIILPVTLLLFYQILERNRKVIVI